MQNQPLPPCPSRYWFDNDPIKTLHANALTTSIPYGERFFVLSVIPYLKKIKDRHLKKQAILFIRQELHHSKAHFKLYLKAVKPHYPRLKTRNCFYQKCFIILAYLLGSKMRLAIVAAMEHFTAVSGHYYLQHPHLLQGMPPAIEQLWTDHFREELEHCACAFDIFQSQGGHYVARFFGFWIASLFLLTGFISTFSHMVIYDKLYKSAPFYKKAYHFFFSKSGIIRPLWMSYIAYLIPQFHPLQKGQKEYLS